MQSSASARPAAKPPGDVDAGVHDARAAGERVHGDAQLGRALDASIGERPRALVHAQVEASGFSHFRSEYTSLRVSARTAVPSRQARC